MASPLYIERYQRLELKNTRAPQYPRIHFTPAFASFNRWNTPTARDFINQIHDGEEHLVVVHVSGGTLFTSTDGSGFVSHGTSTAEAGAPSRDNNPGLGLGTADPDAFIDEAIMWTNVNLNDLDVLEYYNLGQSGIPLSGPEEPVVPAVPTGISGNMTLSIVGEITIPPTGISGIPCTGVHPDADIDPTVTSGTNLTACSGSEVHKNVVLGNDVSLGELVNIHQDVVMGNNVVIRKSSVIQKDAVIGNDLDMGSENGIGKDDCISNNVTIGDVNTINKDVTIANDVTIGDNNTINKDVRICNGSILGNNNTISKGVHIGVVPGANIDDCPLDCEGNVVIGNDNQIGNGAMIGKDVIIGNNVGIGRNAVIGEGAKIGDDVEIKKGETIPPGVNVGYSYLFHYKITP